LRLADFLYDLPEELIAQEPLADRSASRLLVLHRKTGDIEHLSFTDAPNLLQKGDLLVMNDTRVTALRLIGKRATGGQVEALLLHDEGGGRFVALTRPAKKLRLGEAIDFEGGLQAVIEDDLTEGKKRIAFHQVDYAHRIKTIGITPLPPYIHTQIEDPGRYQTVYAQTAGSAAAPTAGLHFTNETLQQLKTNGIDTATVTLDVSLDTFRPIGTVNVEDHVMHGERCSVPGETAQAIKRCEGRVFAVGTTTVRTLETFANSRHEVAQGETVSKLFITPGHEFRAVDAMFTNFHLPGTTLMLLVSAFAGRENVLRAYKEAVEKRYRFLSFGDAMLIK